MFKLIVNHRIVVAGAVVGFQFACGICSADSTTRQGAPTDTSPLLAASTIQVTETVRQLGHGGKSLPPIRVDIKIARPDKIWIQQTVLPFDGKPGATKKLALFSIDGKMQYEYDFDTNQYVKSAAPPSGDAPRPQLVYSYYQADIDSLLHPDRVQEQPGAEKTVTAEMLEGKSVRLTTTRFPARKLDDGATVLNWNKVWQDATTGLTLRQTSYYSLNGDGKENESSRTDFTNWKLGAPIKASAFAWSPPSKATVYVEPKLLAVGTTAPDFTVIGRDGQKMHLSDLRGKSVVIDFWATWCGPCQGEMPSLERTYQLVKEQNVVILALCVWDDRTEYDKWLKKNMGTKYNFTVAFDPAGEDVKTSIAARLFHVRGIPTQYVIDKDGKVAQAYTGWYPIDNRAEDALYNLGVNIPKPDKLTSN